MSKKNNQIPEQSSRIFRRIQTYPIHNMVKFTISCSQKKKSQQEAGKITIIRRIINQKILIQIVLLDKDIKAVFINESYMFKKLAQSSKNYSQIRPTHFYKLSFIEI